VKIAVYTIAKDENGFVERWVDSAKEADSLHILDTGSVDRTVSTATDLGVDVARWTFDPFRFDAARTFALSLVPSDVDMCIALDMDEVLVEGWRDHVEKAYSDGVTRPRYKYVWSWKDGKEGLIFGGNKIHSRFGYGWKHPVHEVLVPRETFVEVEGWYGLAIHHHPDPFKSRSHYLPLLELAVEEDPTDDRNRHYLGREYYFAGRMEEAAEQFTTHLKLPKAVWRPERAASMRYLAKCQPDLAYEWLSYATEECPDRREPWVDMASWCYEQARWDECLSSSVAALTIKEKPLEYLCEEEAWGSLPHDLAAIAAYRLGYHHEAEYHGMQALVIDPYDERLVGNMGFYREAAA